MNRKILSLIIAAVIIVVIAAVAISMGSGDNKESEEIHANGIMIDQVSISLNEGESYTLTATVVPKGCTDPVIWTSSDTSVCTVEGGKIVAVKAGTASVSAQCWKEKVECAVEVKASDSAVSGIMIDKATLDLAPSESYTLTATVIPEGTEVTWSTSDASICTVDGGKVVAIKEGSCTITATAGSESAKCDVTVKESASVGEQNALGKALSYLSFNAYSEKELYNQLLFEQFTESEAKYAVENCGADWHEQASKKAASYLSTSAYSETGLFNQLIFSHFTEDQARNAVDSCGADWYEQASKKASSYLSSMSFSKSSLITQLIAEGFTEDQAQKAVEDCGADWYDQAVLKAKSYLSTSSMSKQSLYQQLMFEGFTEDQAQKAVDQLYV